MYSTVGRVGEAAVRPIDSTKEARQHHGVVVAGQVEDAEHLVAADELQLGGQLAERDDHDHEQRRVGPEDLHLLLFFLVFF